MSKRRRNVIIGKHQPSPRAFTLVEVLVVMFIFLILAAVALPTVRGLISDQKVTVTARNLTAFIDVARSRAIADGRKAGIVITRAGNLTSPEGRAASIRVRHVIGVPSYSGEASNAVAQLQSDGLTAHFIASDNQLLALSASLVADPMVSGDVDDPNAPIRSGDTIELPGGRIVPFVIQFRDLSQPDTVPVVITFDLTEPTNGLSRRFPSAVDGARSMIPLAGRQVKYKIHRRPTVSSSSPFTFPRGVAVDFNYSGMGPTGNEFAPHYDAMSMTWTAANDIWIVFGSDGKVASIRNTFGTLIEPTGLIFVCLGSIDGVRPDSLFDDEPRATANLRSLDSTWIVIDPSTGRVSASPFATVSTVPAGVVTDPDNASLGVAIAEARSLALLSDTVDTE